MSAKERELFTSLEALDKAYIIEWLDSIKKIDPELVKNPITTKKIDTKTTNMANTYPMIIKWCLKNIKGYDFEGKPRIPNIKKISKSIGLDIGVGSPGSPGSPGSSGPAARGGPKPPKPPKTPNPTRPTRPDITKILEAWKKNPEIHPETGEPLEIFINPESQYAKLYKKYIKELVDDVLLKKQGSSSPNKDRLSIKDCNYIKECMPIAHTVAEIKGGWRNREVLGTIFYDPLFIKYFVKLQNNYDTNYTKVIDIYLYSIVYDTFEENFKKDPFPTDVKYNAYNTAIGILRSPYTTFKEGKYELGTFVYNLCKDIKNVLYMHESKITEENINKASYNKEVLKYIVSLITLSTNNNQVRNGIIDYYNKTYLDIYGQFKPNVFNSSANRASDDNNVHIIYNQIINHIQDHQYRNSNENVLDTLLAIYESILKLYSDNNMKNVIYKKIDDEYKTPTVLEPPVPRQEKLPIDLERTRVIMKSNPRAAINPEKKEFLDVDAERWKQQIEKYNKDKAKTRNELIQKMKNREREKKNERVKGRMPGKIQQIFDKIKRGNVSAYSRNKKWEDERLSIHKRAYNSASPPRVTIIKKIDKLKANSATANHISASSTGSDKVQHPDDYYNNDADPYTQEDFADMLPYKRKHTTDIVHRVNRKEFHYRYDTVSLYNTIIDSIRDCTRPVNIAVGRDTLLTDENLDEVCSKIKYFTKQPTYASCNEINAALANCKYDNCLELTFASNINHGIISRIDRTGDYEIVGKYHIYLNLKLGGILFRVINKIADVSNVYDDFPNQTNVTNSIVVTLPILHMDMQNIYRDDPDYTDGDVILMYMKDRLAKGELLGDKYFPNRKNNAPGARWNKVVDIDDYVLDMNEDSETTNMKLKHFKAELALL